MPRIQWAVGGLLQSEDSLSAWTFTFWGWLPFSGKQQAPRVSMVFQWAPGSPFAVQLEGS